ncbi:MAG: hypothetical protein A3H36_01680 [Chloroflexi bacterium RIFCSPLOWO2_02_FULL_71_16]|nr:MAG: hypothetical protein A3H36_01680 [Chloroflexi bacterium RIFCSPLOWO2_02_FULL_71_16]
MDAVSEPLVDGDGGGVVLADVQNDVAVLRERGLRHGGRHRGGHAAVAVGHARQDVADRGYAGVLRTHVCPGGRRDAAVHVHGAVDLTAQALRREVRPRRLAVELDDVRELLRPEPRHLVADERPERPLAHDHALHPVQPIEAVRLLDREAGRRRRGDDEAGLTEAPEDGGQALRFPHPEAGAERQDLDQERSGDDLSPAPRDPPVGGVDVRAVEVRERIRREETVALEEGADLGLGRALIDADVWHERRRGHPSSTG